MIDPNDEDLISLAEVGRILAIDGKPTNPATLWRWSTIGRGPKRIRLETIHVGGRTCSSREALSRFLEALNPEEAAITPRSEAQRTRAAERAAKQLEAAGI